MIYFIYKFIFRDSFFLIWASVAQLAEQLICNQWVGGSIPFAGSIIGIKNGEVPEWLKGADCKSAGEAFGGSNPPLSTIFFIYFMVSLFLAGIAQLARASAFQAEGRGFKSRFPLHFFKGV